MTVRPETTRSTSAPTAPRYAVVRSGPDGAQIVDQGTLSPDTFATSFLEAYGMEGERLHPRPDAVVRGLLAAWDRSRLVTVPIRAWQAGQDERWLCQGSEDGTPPAFSVVADSPEELVATIHGRLASSE